MNELWHKRNAPLSLAGTAEKGPCILVYCENVHLNMVAVMNGACKPRKLQPGAALLFGVLIGLSLLPVLKLLAGTQLFSCRGVSLCPTLRNATAAVPAAQGPAAAFSSFIYPTWPATDLTPAVSDPAGSEPREPVARQAAGGGG